MELLPTLLGALPDLGVAGVVLVVMVVGKRLLDSERAYFTQQRQEYRAEAREDRAELKQEIAEHKAEIRDLEERLDAVRDARWAAAQPTERIPAITSRSPPQS